MEVRHMCPYPKDPNLWPDYEKQYHLAWADHGYHSPGGLKLWTQVRENVAKQVCITPGANVGDPTDRPKVAITRGRLTKGVFVNTPTSDDAHSTPQPEVTKCVWKQLTTDVWTVCGDDPNGPLQQLVGRLKPGYVLCRTQVSVDGTWALYITRSRQCIVLDMVAPHVTEPVEKDAQKGAAYLKMLTDRVPEHVDAFEQDYEGAMEGALELGRARLRPALKAARDAGYGSSGSNGSGTPDEDTDEE
jgi:hypothetical protein